MKLNSKGFKLLHPFSHNLVLSSLILRIELSRYLNTLPNKQCPDLNLYNRIGPKFNLKVHLLTLKRKISRGLVTFVSSPPLNLPLPPQDYEGQPFPLPALPYSDIPVGGRLAHFVEKWEEITDNKWVLSNVRHRFRIPFSKIPPLSSVPIRMSQSSSPFIREEIENLLNKQAVERVQNPGTPGFYSWIFLVPKKICLIIDLSLLNRYIKKQSFKMETVKSVRQAMRLGCLHRLNRCIPTCSDTSSIPEVSSFRSRRSGLSLHGLTVRNVSKSVDILETDGRYSSVSTPTCHISLPIPRRLADQKSDSQPFDYSDKILYSNYSKSRFSAKSQEIGPLPFSEIHLYRHGISDPTKFSQGSNGSCTEPTSDNQEISVIQTCIGTNFPFSFGQTQCCSKLRSPRQTSLTSSSDVSFVCLETSYSSSRSSNYDKRYDSISLTMVDKPQSVRDRDYYPSSRSQIFLLYRCQSFRMGSSFRADDTILSWSLDRRPIPAPYQYVSNDGHTISTETSHNIYSPFLHHDIYRQHNGGLIYQQTGWHTFPQPLCRSLENSQLVPGTQHRYQSSSHSRQIQHSCRPPIKIRQTYQDRMGSGSNSMEFSIPDAQFPKCGPVCDTIQSQTPIICLSSTRQQSTSDRCPVHGLESSSCICFSSFYSDSCCSGKNPTTSVQNSSDSSVLATTTVVLRTSSSLSVSSDSSATNSKTLDSIQRKICSSKPPTSRPSCLGVIKKSIRDKKISQNVADFVSRSRRTSTQKVYDAKWTIFYNWCHTKKVNLISAPITVIADFLICLFLEKNCQISTIKGYRAMISNTLKFKTGNRIGSNPVLSELIRSFELQ